MLRGEGELMLRARPSLSSARSRRRPLALLLALGGLALSGCGASSMQVPTVASTSPPSAYAASAVVASGRVAPDFSLLNQAGRTVRLSRFRGRAVFITFVYAHCPDECPLIVAKLHQALTMLGGQARRVQVIGVSVDPAGDTPAVVNRFLRAHGMSAEMQYLLGSRTQLAPVWQAYNVAVAPAGSADPDGVVGHSALVYGIGASGRERTVYAADTFDPSAIVHDVPLLLAH